MKLFSSASGLALAAAASFAFAASVASAQQIEPGPEAEAVEGATMPGEPVAPTDPQAFPQLGPPGVATAPEFAQIIPPICFDPTTGDFTVDLSPAVCGIFEGAPGTEGGLGPTGTIPRTAAAPGVAMQPAPPAAPPAEAQVLPEGEQTPSPPGAAY